MSVIHRLALVGAATLVASCQQSEAMSTTTATTVENTRGAAADEAMRPAPTRSATDAPSAQTKAPSATIPARFRGTWGMAGEQCGTSFDDGRLEIGERTVRFHESEGEVQSAVENDGALRITLALAGEGERWTSDYRWSLSADGDRLTQNGGLTRVRCRP